jgi:hypothetical protein
VTGEPRPYHDGPVVDILTPMPLALAAELMDAVSKVCERHGLEAYFNEDDGLARIHARPVKRPVPTGPVPR